MPKVSQQKIPAQRYTMELTPEEVQIVGDLADATGIRTQKDVFLSSIAMLAWAVREVGRGRIIASFDEKSKTYAELQMPALMKAATRHENTKNNEGEAA